jgi:hypothetical protein
MSARANWLVQHGSFCGCLSDMDESSVATVHNSKPVKACVASICVYVCRTEGCCCCAYVLSASADC